MRRWLLARIIALQVFAGIFSKMDGIRKQEQNALSGSRTENIYSIAYAQAWTETSAVTAETVRQSSSAREERTEGDKSCRFCRKSSADEENEDSTGIKKAAESGG